MIMTMAMILRIALGTQRKRQRGYEDEEEKEENEEGDEENGTG
jgi:hypothetical protein